MNLLANLKQSNWNESSFTSWLPVKTGTSDQQVATAFQQIAIATSQWQYPKLKAFDPDQRFNNTN